LAAVIPAGARRFRVGDHELARTLSIAGADLVEAVPDVEIGAASELQGDADCAVVEVGIPQRRGQQRLVRGARRLVGSAQILAQAARARAKLRALGYSSTSLVTWERGVALGHKHYDPQRRTLAHRFPLNVIVVGRRSSSDETELDVAVEAAEAHLEQPLRPERVVPGASGVIVAVAQAFVFRAAIGPAATRIEEQRAALALLRDKNPPPLVADRVPWLAAHGKTGLTLWSVERRLPGSVPGPRLTTALVADSIDFLQQLHLTAEGEGSRDVNMRRALSIAELSGDRSSTLRDFGAALDQELGRVPGGFSHGDFWTGNMLMGRGGLTGVVDWSSAETHSIPLFDLLHLEVASVRELEGWELPSALVRHLRPRMRAGGSELFRLYCRRLGIDLNESEREALVGAYWLQALAHELFDPDHDPDQVADPKWRRQNIDLVLDSLSGVGR